MSRRDLPDSLRDARVIVCAGTGGVGKTTISAALGLEAALAGRKTLVLTIDPARRLADALGIEAVGSTPTPIKIDVLAGDPRAKTSAGSLAAMMLDPKPTFDGLVTRYSKDAATRDRILENRIYRHLSEALAGSAEYAAMIQVHDLMDSGNYDLIVVDTPPAAHALDFLRAPQRMREFLESRFVRTLVQPAVSVSRFGARLLGKGLERILSLIERIAGGGFLDDISEFLTAVDGLAVGLDQRSKDVEDFLLGADSSFVLVCGGQARANRSALEFLSELEQFRVPLAAVVANRLRPWPIEKAPSEIDFSLEDARVAGDAKRLSEMLGDATAGNEIVLRLSEYAEVCATQSHALDDLEAAARSRKIQSVHVRELSGEIDHLEGLAEIGAMLSARPMSPASRADEKTTAAR